MITISLCMIVKNEEAVLARCLDSVADLMDEIIIVDTGSTDRTKEIAAKYTDKIYDFTWCDDFSAARNFSFSKATMDYIYAPDADEMLDKENHDKFAVLKEAMIPEVEIVQMEYLTTALHNTVQNSSCELRPKLFKRLRTFTWIDPIHETVRLDPVVFDSDIQILHLPQSSHSKRDFAIFEKAFAKDGVLSKNIVDMYAKELIKCGEPCDIENAMPVFLPRYEETADMDAACIVARYYRYAGLVDEFFSVALKCAVQETPSEICCELGHYYMGKGNYQEAALWFYNAAYETTPILSVETNGIIPLTALAQCYEACGLKEEAAEYLQKAKEWQLPEVL